MKLENTTSEIVIQLDKRHKPVGEFSCTVIWAGAFVMFGALSFTSSTVITALAVDSSEGLPLSRAVMVNSYRSLVSRSRGAAVVTVPLELMEKAFPTSPPERERREWISSKK